MSTSSEIELGYSHLPFNYFPFFLSFSLSLSTRISLCQNINRDRRLQNHWRIQDRTAEIGKIAYLINVNMQNDTERERSVLLDDIIRSEKKQTHQRQSYLHHERDQILRIDQHVDVGTNSVECIGSDIVIFDLSTTSLSTAE